MRKINLLEFIPDLANGGAQALVRDYTRLIDRTKFNMYLLTTYPAPLSANVKLIKETDTELKSIYPRYSLPYKIMNNIAPLYFVSSSLLRTVRKYEINVIHVHLNILKYLVPIRKQLKGVKLIYTCHSLPSQFFSGPNKSEFEAARILIKDNNLQIIALHEDMRNELNSLFGIKNTVVIRNGVEFDRFQNIIESKEDIRKSINLPEESFVVGHVGRFADMKNHKFLVDVFYEVSKRNPNAYLLMVGSGPMVGEVIEKISTLGLANRTVHLENRSDVPRLVKAMDIFVFPSIFEGLPVSVVEAQVAGIRVVSSDKVTNECFFLPSLVSMSIDDTPEHWADVILDDNAKGEYDRDISVFNMKSEIKRLEELYS